MNDGPDAPDLVFLGTSVVSGTATAVVTATGAGTLFGDIAPARQPRRRRPSSKAACAGSAC